MIDTKQQQFAAHITRLCRAAVQALAAEHYDVLAIYAGNMQQYFADDQELPFRPTPHFTHWCPLRSAGHVLLISADQRPHLYLQRRPNYWVDAEPQLDSFWVDSFTINVSDNITALLHKKFAANRATQKSARYAWIGPEVSWLPDAVVCNPTSLCQRLDAIRSVKSAYEIACIRAANVIAKRGHARLRESFAAGLSEFELHLAYLQATQQTDNELPYPTIIALDEKAAILHYQHKRTTVREGKVLLADCGASVHGYAADVTRTWTSPRAHPLFIELGAALERIQQELCGEVKDGVPFYDLHYHAHEKITALLIASQLLQNVSKDEALASGLSKIFFPHGLGHLLGIQTHDVGGERLPCPYAKPLLEVFANMRFKGKLVTDEVVTIEPGIYFIPLLLDQHSHDRRLNQKLITALRPYGGIRIEDNLHVRANDAVNLTRIQ